MPLRQGHGRAGGRLPRAVPASRRGGSAPRGPRGIAVSYLSRLNSDTSLRAVSNARRSCAGSDLQCTGRNHERVGLRLPVCRLALTSRSAPVDGLMQPAEDVKPPGSYRADRQVESQAFRERCRADAYCLERGHIIEWRNLTGDERMRVRPGDAWAWSRRPADSAHAMWATMASQIGRGCRRIANRGKQSWQVAGRDCRGRRARGRAFDRCLHVLRGAQCVGRAGPSREVANRTAHPGSTGLQWRTGRHVQ